MALIPTCLLGLGRYVCSGILLIATQMPRMQSGSWKSLPQHFSVMARSFSRTALALLALTSFGLLVCIESKPQGHHSVVVRLCVHVSCLDKIGLQSSRERSFPLGDLSVLSGSMIIMMVAGMCVGL